MKRVTVVQCAFGASRKKGLARETRFVHRISGISFTSRAQHDAPTYTKFEWLFYRIFLFTLRAQSDASTYTKPEWLFYRIFLLTLRAQRDAFTYTSTTDQCGAYSGLPQPVIFFDLRCESDTYVYVLALKWNGSHYIVRNLLNKY